MLLKMVFIFSGLLLFLILLANPLSYVLALAVFSLYSIYCSVYYYALSTLIGLLVLLVYYGAVVVLISYVCAIIPNVYYESVSYFYVFMVGFSIFMFLFGMFIFSNSIILAETGLSDVYLTPFFYSFLGVGLFVLMFCMMLIIMVSSSFYVKVSSPLRSV